MEEPHRDLLQRYTQGPQQLRAALAGLSEADLDRSLAPDSWTIRQYVHHIADGDAIWAVGIQAALGNSQGQFTLQWYWEVPQTRWAESWAYAGRSIEPSLALLEANRRHIVQLLEQVPGALERTITICWPSERAQPVPVSWIVEMQAQHVSGHIDDIRTIRQARGAISC